VGARDGAVNVNVSARDGAANVSALDQGAVNVNVSARDGAVDVNVSARDCAVNVNVSARGGGAVDVNVRVLREDGNRQRRDTQGYCTEVLSIASVKRPKFQGLDVFMP
jgi:hypothetical protein